MNRFDSTRSAACADVDTRLSEYTDNSLAAREAWEVEKHLSICPACAARSREYAATVHLLRSTPRMDTPDGFMAALHARLDGMEPEMARRPGLVGRLRDWASRVDPTARAYRAPALGFGLAATALIAMAALQRPHDSGSFAPVAAVTADSVHVSIAVSASSPFSDPAADNLELRSSARGAKSSAAF